MSIRANLFGHISIYGSNDLAVASGIDLHNGEDVRTIPITNLIIGLCTRGRARALRGSDFELNAKEGDLFILPPHCQIRFLEKSCNFDIRILIISEHFKRRDIYRKSVPISHLVHFIDASPIIEADEQDARYFMDTLNLIEKTIQQNFGDFQSDMLLHLVSAVSSLLNAIIARKYPVKSVSISRSEHIFGLFTNLVAEHFRQHHELQFYADTLCITPKYLSAICTKVCGHPGSRWIAYYIVNEAKNMLKTRHMNITQISDALGFVNASCFCKFFHKETGISPSEYRRS